MSFLRNRQLLLSLAEPGYGLPRWTDVLSIALALVILNNVFSLTPQLPQAAFYAVVIAISSLLLLKVVRGGLIVNPLMWGFWGVMWLSIFVNSSEIPAHFQSSHRTIAFLLVLMVTAPYFSGRPLNAVRDRMFDVMNLAMLLMAFLSFLGRVFSFLPTDNQGFYLGCTHHSMDLACLCGIALVYAGHRYVASGTDMRLKSLFAASFAGTLLVLLFSSSRTSTLAGVLGVLTYFGLGASQSVARVVRPAIVLCVLLYGIFMLFPEAFSGLRRKSQDSAEGVTIASLSSSRSGIWENRLKEIQESPVFGTGAHTIRYGGSSSKGTIEPGNAWLYVFSSMGVFSFLLFCGMMLYGIQRCRRYARPGSRASLVLGLLVYFSLYMMGEAHITAVGEFSCSYFWLLLSVAFHHDFRKDTESVPSVVPVPSVQPAALP